jgi:hypothetical protein
MSTHPEEGMYLTHETHGVGGYGRVDTDRHLRKSYPSFKHTGGAGSETHVTFGRESHARAFAKESGGKYVGKVFGPHHTVAVHQSGWAAWKAKHGK